jgi:hypothetical protein
MIKYSHVSLIILCDTAAEAEAITAHLGIPPTRLRESKLRSGNKEKGLTEKISFSWMLDSPKSHTDADVPERLSALADAIEPINERLHTLKSLHKPWVDVVYHNTPQHSRGITGEFHWFRMPAEIMRRFSSWDLSISYEVFWFNHPDWEQPKRAGLLSRFVQSLSGFGKKRESRQSKY